MAGQNGQGREIAATRFPLCRCNLMSTQKQPPVPPPVQVCPHCRSRNVKPVPFVYESGTTVSGGATLGLGVAGRHVALFGAGSSGQSQSLFVQRLAPPSKPGLSYWHWGWAILSPFILFNGAMLLNGRQSIDVFPAERIAQTSRFFIFASFGVICSVIGWWRQRMARKAWLQAYARWDQSKVCVDCGNVYE
jgi:hypothetical protein